MSTYLKRMLAAACLIALSPANLLAAEASQLSARQSIVIDAPTEKVWEVVSDFAGLHKWFPFIAETRLVLGENRRLGAIRELRRSNGTKVEEKLVEYDPYNMIAAYTYMGGQPLTSDYYSTMTVSDAGNGKSKVEWKATFKRLHYWTETPPKGQENVTLEKLLNKVYALGLESLKAHIESPAQ